jgi:hypothetical protein
MRRGIVLGAVLIVGAIAFYAAQWSVAALILRKGDPIAKAEVHLLCDTDYAALLGACRELSQRAGELGLVRGREYRIRFDRSPEVTKFPQVICGLDPAYVELTDNYVWIAL